MRFCMVTTFYPPYHFGGDAVYVRALARALSRRGHEVEVVHCEDAYRLRGRRTRPDGREDPDIVVHRLRSRLGALSPLVTHQTGTPGLKARRLKEILDRDFDVVNFHNVSLVGGPGVLGMSRAPVTLYTLHEHWLLCPMHVFWKNRNRACDSPQCVRCCLRSGIPVQLWRYTDALSRGLEHVDALLAPSAYTAQLHRAAGITRPIHVLPLFSELDPGSGTPFRRTDRPTFLFVGRVTASKGIVELVADFADLPEYDLVVVGDGDARLALESRYAGCRHVRFLGAVPHPELVSWYQRAVALVLPSLAPEVFPLSVLEAFACGTPAVVRDAGGSREAVDTTGAGIVYRSKQELVAALHALATTPELRATLGRRARVGFETLYSEERHLAGYLEQIASLSGGNGRRPGRVTRSLQLAR